MYRKIIDTFSTNVAGMILGLLVSILLARGLGPEGLGIRAFLFLFPGTLYICLGINFFTSIIYFLRSGELSTERILTAGTVFFVLLTSLMYTVLFVVNQLWDFPFLYFLLIIIFLENATHFAGGMLLGTGNIILQNRLFLFKNLFFFLLVFSLYWLNNRVISLGHVLALDALSRLFYVAVGFMVFFTQTKCRPQIEFSVSVIRDLKKILSYSSYSYISNMCNYLNYRFDQWMIKIFLGDASLGIYSVITTISERFWLLPGAIAHVLFPEIAGMRKKQSFDKAIRSIDKMTIYTSLFGAFVWTSGFYLIKPVIVLLYGQAFSEVAILFQILFPGIILFSSVKIIAGFFAGLGRPDLRVKTAILATVINVVLNLFFIPRYGLIGAAVATLFSYCFYGFSILWTYRLVRKEPERFLRIPLSEGYDDKP